MADFNQNFMTLKKEVERLRKLRNRSTGQKTAQNHLKRGQEGEEGDISTQKKSPVKHPNSRPLNLPSGVKTPLMGDSRPNELPADTRTGQYGPKKVDINTKIKSIYSKISSLSLPRNTKFEEDEFKDGNPDQYHQNNDRDVETDKVERFLHPSRKMIDTDDSDDIQDLRRAQRNHLAPFHAKNAQLISNYQEKLKKKMIAQNQQFQQNCEQFGRNQERDRVNQVNDGLYQLDKAEAEFRNEFSQKMSELGLTLKNESECSEIDSGDNYAPNYRSITSSQSSKGLRQHKTPTNTKNLKSEQKRESHRSNVIDIKNTDRTMQEPSELPRRSQIGSENYQKVDKDPQPQNQNLYQTNHFQDTIEFRLTSERDPDPQNRLVSEYIQNMEPLSTDQNRLKIVTSRTSQGLIEDSPPSTSPQNSFKTGYGVDDHEIEINPEIYKFIINEVPERFRHQDSLPIHIITDIAASLYSFTSSEKLNLADFFKKLKIAKNDKSVEGMIESAILAKTVPKNTPLGIYFLRKSLEFGFKKKLEKLKKRLAVGDQLMQEAGNLITLVKRREAAVRSKEAGYAKMVRSARNEILKEIERKGAKMGVEWGRRVKEMQGVVEGLRKKLDTCAGRVRRDCLRLRKKNENLGKEVKELKESNVGFKKDKKELKKKLKASKKGLKWPQKVGKRHKFSQTEIVENEQKIPKKEKNGPKGFKNELDEGRIGVRSGLKTMKRSKNGNFSRGLAMQLIDLHGQNPHTDHRELLHMVKYLLISGFQDADVHLAIQKIFQKKHYSEQFYRTLVQSGLLPALSEIKQLGVHQTNSVLGVFMEQLLTNNFEDLGKNWALNLFLDTNNSGLEPYILSKQVSSDEEPENFWILFLCKTVCRAFDWAEKEVLEKALLIAERLSFFFSTSSNFFASEAPQKMDYLRKNLIQMAVFVEGRLKKVQEGASLGNQNGGGGPSRRARSRDRRGRGGGRGRGGTTDKAGKDWLGDTSFLERNLRMMQVNLGMEK